ncbi:MAG: hypothetical protein ACE5JF_11045 [Anaerolineales bacterium]
MNLRNLMIINAVVATVFGFAFLLVPGDLISQYGVEANAAMRNLGQLLGAALISFAVLTWWARNANDSTARRAIVLALFIGNVAGFIVALIGQLNEVVNTLGWSTVVIYALLTLGYGYFQFFKPASREVPSAAD